MDPFDVPFHEWTPCEVHGHLFVDGDGDPVQGDEFGRCRDCGEDNGQDKPTCASEGEPRRNWCLACLKDAPDECSLGEAT